MKKSARFTVEAAKAFQETLPEDDQEFSGVCGYPYPSVEAFLDEWLENIVGFSSTYPDESRVQQWIESAQERMADMMGPEAVVLAGMLIECMLAIDDENYTEALRIHGDDEAWKHAECVTGDPDWFTAACDLVRELIDSN